MSEIKSVNLSNLERFLANIKAKFVQIKDAVLSVNGNTPDAFGNIQISQVATAGDLESSSIQSNSGEFIIRTAGGDASITSGEARLVSIQGRAVHSGYVSDEDRGTISVSYPTAFVATGWNLYQEDDSYTGYTGYARVVNYSGNFRVAGDYGSLKFSATLEGDRSNLTVTSQVISGFPSGWENGYIWVTSGNSSNTEIYMTWNDWTNGRTGSFAPYSTTTIDLSDLFGEGNPFPYGLLQVGSVYDEIDFTAQGGGQAISRVDRVSYSAEAAAEAASSGREWDADADYIYIAKASPDITSELGIDRTYTANDHGMELFENTIVPVFAQSNYGASLRNKLERDVLTISQQTLTADQKAQVINNIGAQSTVVSTGEITKPSTIPGTLTDVTCRKVGNTVFASGRIHTINPATTANGVFFNVSSGFRPSVATKIIGSMQVSGNFIPVAVTVTASGTVSYSYSTTQQTTQVYFAGSWSVI